jgi:hypothetical protein
MGNYFACNDDDLELAEAEDAGLVPMRPWRAQAIRHFEQELQDVRRVNAETWAQIQQEHPKTLPSN